jgi:hypothetical protein
MMTSVLHASLQVVEEQVLVSAVPLLWNLPTGGARFVKSLVITEK